MKYCANCERQGILLCSDCTSTKVYLCARVAAEARPANKRVALSLEKFGFSVYLPQEQAPNNPDVSKGERYDAETIFKLDFAALSSADIYVVVGKFGKDCAWEIGWAAAVGKPIFFVPNGDESWLDTPMVIPSLNQYPQLTNLDTVGAEISYLLKR